MAAPRELDLTVTLDTAWHTWREDLLSRVEGGQFSGATVRGYTSYARRFVDHIGPARTCDSVEAEEIREWIGSYRSRGSTVGPDTLRFCYKGAKGLLTWADHQRWLRENPMRDVPAPPPGRGPTRRERAALTRPELDSVIAAAARGHGSGSPDPGMWVRDEIVIRLAAESGLRNADIRNLNVDDVDRDPAGNWYVHIRCGKGRKARTTPITTACATLIRDYTDQHRPVPGTRPDRVDRHGQILRGDAGALLLSAFHHRLTAANLARIVAGCAQAALGRHLVPHGLRHTAGTLLAREAKADMAIVAHVLGHSDISVTSVYLDTRTDEAAAAVNRRKPGRQAPKTRALPPGMDTPTWPGICGTRTGWNRHRRERIPRCGPCRLWKREHDQDRRALLRLMPQRLHGTDTGWRDWRCPCQKCADARAEARRTKGAAHKPRPRVSLLKKPTTAPRAPRPAAPCGTPAGYKQHRRSGEPPCRPCLDAVAAYSREKVALRPAPGSRPRAVCPGCGQIRALTAEGVMRRHSHGNTLCPGAGELPEECAA